MTMESSRKSTLAAQTARHEACIKQREDDKQRRKREALRRVAPGFEPDSGPLVPTRMATAMSDRANPIPQQASAENGESQATTATSGGSSSHVRTRSVMDDLVDHLAALDAVSSHSTEKK